MTERNIGSTFEWFIGKVVDRMNDETKSGKVKVRIYGIHDDESNVPDSDLPWAYPLMPITSASFEHVGQAPTGITEGATVFGFFMDKDKQIPVLFGTMYRSKLPTDEDKKGDSKVTNP